MITAELLAETWAELFHNKRPIDVLTLVGYELPDLSDRDAWENPVLNELEQVTSVLANRVAEKSDFHPFSIFVTGIALGYLAANREVLEGVKS